ncbi:MAG: autotransporter assembly complex protein TamA [Sideroxydans sp.]|nr:autotransporter assembly complex protein TamA [Sideroxydans sp.]
MGKQAVIEKLPRSAGVLLMCLCLLHPALAHAKTNPVIPAVNLIAPKEVRDVLKEFFVLPEAMLADESERAVFMRRAQREIPELLATEGYFSGKVVLRGVADDGVLELEVLPGARTLVSEVSIEFRGDLALDEASRNARAQQLRAAWKLPVGKPFRAGDWDEAKTDLQAQVAARDYAAALLVESAAQVDAAKAVARLRIVIDSGPRYVFGALQVSGLERYEELMVTRNTTFSRGEPYQRGKLLSFQTKLQNQPQFASVVVNLDTAAATANPAGDGAVTAPVKVKVVEALSRKITLGVGYSTNNGVRNEATYQSYNFLNQAWTLNGSLLLEKNRQNFSTGLDTPPNPLGYRLLWKGSSEKTQIEGLETRLDKFGVTRSRTLYGIETGIGLNWQEEQRLPTGGIRETDQALVLDWRWYRREVDDPLAPMSGELTEIRVGGASKALLSDQDFMRGYIRHQAWMPLGKNDVISLRLEAGFTAASSRLGIPQEYLFRVGGTQTVRGFAYQSLGVSEGSAIVGGRAMTSTSLEYTHWFGNFGVALFTDAGGAADTVPELRLSQGSGYGVRWHSPVGPLALDIARGKGEPQSRIHFAIAVAF